MSELLLQKNEFRLIQYIKELQISTTPTPHPYLPPPSTGLTGLLQTSLMITDTVLMSVFFFKDCLNKIILMGRLVLFKALKKSPAFAAVKLTFENT